MVGSQSKNMLISRDAGQKVEILTTIKRAEERSEKMQAH